MTEEIKKLIEAEAKDRFSHNVFRAFTDIEKNIAITEFKYGGLFVLSKWQEAERWRKVEEELPDPDIAVLCRMKSTNVIVEGFIYKHNGIAKIETQPDFEFEDYADGEVIEWKPIS